MNKSENEALSDNIQEGAEQQNPENNTMNTENSAENPVSDGQNNRENEIQQQLADANDKYLRLYSEFDNFRKRTTREKVELIKTAGEDIFKAFLPIIDDFERAIKANETTTDIKTVNEGIQLIYNKMKHSFTQKGLEPMNCSGKVFDADTMEAITHIPSPDEDLKGKVVDEVEKGYLLNGKVIRYAKVVVGS